MNLNQDTHVHKSRAQLLMTQSRYLPAIEELGQYLAHEPEDSGAHAMMAVSYAQIGNNAEALRWADLAVRLDPNSGYCHWARAFVLEKNEKYKEAEESALEALRVDPFEPDFYSMLGHIRMEQKNWTGAVEAAEHGLSLDAEDSACINIRAFALLRQGKKDHADAAIHSALVNNPEDAVSHANQGWICLGRGEQERALSHFKEAIRLDPSLDSARQGILESLANKYIVYRYLYQYFEWMASFNSGLQRGIIFGIWVVNRALVAVTSGNVKLAIILIYGFVVFLTWTGRSPFDLLLRLNPLGRLALNRRQIIASNWVGLCLAGGLISLGAAFATGLLSPLLAAGCFVLLAIPGARIARTRGPLNVVNTCYAVIFLAIAGLEIFDCVTRGAVSWPVYSLITLIWCGVIYTWVSSLFKGSKSF